MDTFDPFNEEVTAELAMARKHEHKEEATEGRLTVDVYQEGDDIVVTSAIAGINPDDMDITITNDMVTIRGQRKSYSDIDSEKYFHREIYWGSFSRSIILPAEIDADNVKATMKNGVLTIRLPKIERHKTKKLKVSQ